ncbi:ABC transporter ATP-binding protein [Paenibacillus doosanensis]|uniref:ABC transporter ATP-binding protein YxlF n=1 Tax=Paenibacillus konkukensis TaxID=2020716 RepID=A0ABY4RU70_9BACL|nr:MULTISPECIES: ABC transporter ATP-binding protein [Paenibacillus]MCS7463781.1 ABC transporter ATP-binding protein [Paenibacillus doosanensis]UQZ85279.1 putative ABC transporter ATP-binding protein YxlF [Paenibacillus konkukensis]
MSQPIIETHALTKDYGNGRGCRGITLTVGTGEAFGFLGPNGAGKSTFVKMLVGLIRPTGGTATIMNEPVGSIEARRHIGYLPELYRYQEWLSGAEVVMLHAKLCGIAPAVAKRRVPELLDRVGIGLRGRDRVKHYSKGMQQRLGLACALVNDPKLVFLDEPASALDPIGRMEVRNLLQELRQEGKTIFLNSHLLEDVELLCDRVALLNNGNILQTGAVSDVLQEKTRWHLCVGGFAPFILTWLTEATGLPIRVTHLPVPHGLSDCVWLEAELEDNEQIGWLNSLIVEQGLTLYEVKKAKTRLDEWFMNAVSGLSHRGERV